MTSIHPRYLGRTIEWGHWGITLLDKQNDPSKNFGVVAGTIYFPVGPRGPVDGFPSSTLRNELNAAVKAWIDLGKLPEQAA